MIRVSWCVWFLVSSYESFGTRVSDDGNQPQAVMIHSSSNSIHYILILTDNCCCLIAFSKSYQEKDSTHSMSVKVQPSAHTLKEHHSHRHYVGRSLWFDRQLLTGLHYRIFQNQPKGYLMQTMRFTWTWFETSCSTIISGRDMSWDQEE